MSNQYIQTQTHRLHLLANKLLRSRECKYSLAKASEKSGVGPVTLRNWLDRGLLPMLDVNKRANAIGHRKHRKFSERDIELIRRVRAATQQPPTVRQAALDIDKTL